MSNNAKSLREIHDRLQLLLKNHQQLQKENERLKQELDQCRGELTAHQENVESLKQQVSVLRLNAGEMQQADKKEFEKKLNGYIREIDRCIAMLSE